MGDETWVGLTLLGYAETGVQATVWATLEVDRGLTMGWLRDYTKEVTGKDLGDPKEAARLTKNTGQRCPGRSQFLGMVDLVRHCRCNRLPSQMALFVSAGSQRGSGLSLSLESAGHPVLCEAKGAANVRGPGRVRTRENLSPTLRLPRRMGNTRLGATEAIREC